MSKSRTNQPNNKTSRIAPRMVWRAEQGTFNAGRNKAKRAERARRAASLVSLAA